MYDLHDMLVETLNELRVLENIPKNYPLIREKKEQLLMLQNAIYLKRMNS